MISNKISDQSDMASDIIKMNPGVVILSVALTRDPSRKLDVQKVDVKR